jgi:hypothetical protein
MIFLHTLEKNNPVKKYPDFSGNNKNPAIRRGFYCYLDISLHEIINM